MSGRHEDEARRNAEIWAAKPLLRDVYRSLYDLVDPWLLAGRPIVEVGSGAGSFKQHRPETFASELFVTPAADLAFDAYRLPFAARSVGTIVLVDVFHHLRTPLAFFDEASRTLVRGGRVILLEPYISLTGWLVYGALHPEPLGLGRPIESSTEPLDRSYYAAQGNATRMFFGSREAPRGWRVVHRHAFASFAYLLSGGFSGPQLLPRALLRAAQRIDGVLSAAPRLFGARCVVVLEIETSAIRS